MTTLYCASWLLPITSAPVRDGAVAVRGGQIVGVGTRDEITRRFPAADLNDFGEAAILPGLVNCHSHLELTVMRGYLEREENNFPAWLQKLTIARNEWMTAEDRYVSAAWGAVEAARAGVTCVGDASDTAAPCVRALRHAGLRGVVYQEVFGPDARTSGEQFAKLREKVERERAGESELVTLGVSPHAPYSVSAPLFEAVAQYARAENLPLMVHAAESEAEEQFMREGRGPLAEGLRRRGIEWSAPGVSSIQYLARLGVTGPRTLLAHCVRADDADVATLAASGTRVAHCPKSNAKFGHGRAPFAAFLRAGVLTGLGSDSVASNNTCDLLEEGRFAVLASRAAGERLADERMVGADEALRAATLAGAWALGFGGLTGALEEGLQADLCVFSLAGAHQTPVHDDPAAALLFASSGRDALLTVVAGREVFRDGRVTTVDEEELRARVKDIARRLGGVTI
ncbi:MAG TPA: amidohydrolase family protein [Pyrinomonadaceae bacterium]